MASNTNIQIANLDFADIKQNFINYLQSQDTFKDYNFSGSALSTLLDVLTYNTQYNAFYLNMVANEMFLDSAIQRSSVISHAKTLNYVPKSAQGAVALINIAFTGITTSTFTIPKNTKFISGQINGVNYQYVTTESTTGAVTGGNVSFSGIELKQGTPQLYTYTVDSNSNPNYIFQIPDSTVDTSTLQVAVQQSISNTNSQIYNLASDYLGLTSTSPVYFLQESTNGNYQIYFGDGVLGNKLTDGNIVLVSYLSTKGSAGGNANSFYLMDNLGNDNLPTIEAISPASTGADKETVDSIKFQAPKAFAAQGRAVSKNDYITAIQQNTLGFQFDAVSVWGGEENNPPIYGQVFVSLKPAGSYDLTLAQKNLIIEQVLKPISVVTIEPTLVDPNYTFIQVNANVIYQQSQTVLNPGGMQSAITASIFNYSADKLNTFNSTFNSYDLLNYINNTDKSIISSDFNINLQKKIYPILGKAASYNMHFNNQLQRGIYGSSLTTYPGIQIVDPANPANTISGVYYEEVPTTSTGVESISVLSTGYNYTSIPTVTITGDGTGATATATVVNGTVTKITVTNAGTGYTIALATITPAAGDTSGAGATAIVTLQNRYGTVRSYYNDSVNGKVIVSGNTGTIDYVNGVVILNIAPVTIDNPLGELTVSVKPTSTLVSSSFNNIISIDPYDSAAVNVIVNAKRN